MASPTVAVIMGGASFERDFSLKSGRHVCRTLEELGYGVLPLDATSELVDALRAERPDVAWVALHGKGGEDGAVPSLLEFLGIPYVGSTPPVCRTTWSKPELPFIMGRVESDGPSPVRWPPQVALPLDAFKDLGAAKALDLVTKRLGVDFPLAVKPAKGGSAMGLTKVEGQGELGEAIMAALAYDDVVVIQQWVEGIELSLTVLGAPGNELVLPPVEIRPLEGIFDIKARQDPDAVRYYCPPNPGDLADDPAEEASIQERCQAAAREVFRAFQCRDVARVDMVWDGFEPLVLDLKVFPGMTETSLVPMALDGAGISFAEFVDGLVKKAMERGV